MASIRIQRVRELLKRQLGEMVRRELPAPQAAVTSVNDVTIARDLKAATVYVGIVAADDEQQRILQSLNHSHAHFQDLLARAVILRQTPRLRFLLDKSVERGNRVISILDEIESDQSDSTP